MMTDKDIALFVLEKLLKLPMVCWDRFTTSDKRITTIYGWLDRPGDTYKDFVLLTIYPEDDAEGETVMITQFATSSAEHSRSMAQLLGMGQNHRECKRVEDYFNIQNMVRRSKEESAKHFKETT